MQRMVTSLVYLLLVSLSAAEEYYVTSYNNGTDCPASERKCEVLSYYMRDFSQYFISDTVFRFLEGTHLLDSSLIVTGVSNISLIGLKNYSASTATTVITCLNGIGSIVFNNSNEIQIHFIAMKNCSNDTTFLSATLCFDEVFNVTINYLTIINSTSNGLVVRNGYGIHIQSSTFTHSNFRNALLYFTSPRKCFSTTRVFNVTIESSTFSFGRFGLWIEISQLSTYLTKTVVDSVIAHNNFESNIFFSMFDGQFHSIDIINVSSWNGLEGLRIACMEYYRKRICPALIVNTHTNINIVKSNFSNNGRGILSSVSCVSAVSSLVHINMCILYGNRHFAMLFDNGRNTDVVLIVWESFIQQNSFLDNKDKAAAITVHRHKLIFKNVIISDNMNTGLLLLHSTVYMIGSDNVFYNNSATNGGAIALFHSDMVVMNNTKLSFISNTAKRKGGAIYIDQICALQIGSQFYNRVNVTLNFTGNSAQIANDIYGLNSPNQCAINVATLASFVYLFTNSEKLFSLSTDSAGVCYCDEDNLLDSLSKCFNETFENQEIKRYNTTKYPGEAIEVPIAIVGYGGKNTYSLTDGIIDIIVNGRKIANIPYNGTHCYKLKYKLVQDNFKNESIEVLIESEPNYLNILSLIRPAISINATLLPCPEGFQLINGICNCIDVLKGMLGVTCNITTKEITVNRIGPVWYGTVKNQSCYSTNIICGYDYCVDDEITFILNNTDVQCNSHRSGILCSQCSQGRSLKLGSNDCDDCNNSFTTMFIFFGFAGVGLIGLIIVLDLTVSIGTINGLILYANVLKMYEHVFFPKGPVPFVSQFISWINLDFGFNICFYDGMDTYSKAWLQFVFPFYIWTLIVIIIVLCHWSMKISKLFGSHVVPALATLLLLSYIKLMRSIVYALSRQHIYIACNSGNSINELRWYPDPSILYLERKHAFLFVFAVFLLILLVIPYTIVLLLSPVLQGYISRYRWCSVWNKLKPVFDAYNAPFKDRLRFWTGFLLVARLPILAAVSTTNLSETDKNALLSVVLSMIAVVFIVANICGGVYRIWYLNVLESSFLLNLAMVTIAAINETSSHTYKGFLITSICISFILFIGIIIFHVYLRFSKGGSQETELKMQRIVKGLLKLKNFEKINRKMSFQNEDDEQMMSEVSEMYNSVKIGASFSELRRRETLLLDDVEDSFVISNRNLSCAKPTDSGTHNN